jgi:hypothetical protein
LIIIQNHEGKDITVEKLVDQYYNNPEKFFQLDSKANNSTPGNSSSGESIIPTTTQESKSEIKVDLQQEQQQSSSSTSQSSEQGSKEEHENNFVKQHLSDDYLGNVENASELQESSFENTESIQIQHSLSKKLFVFPISNNLFYSCQSQAEMQNKEQLSCISSKIVSSTEEVSPLPQPQLQKQEEQQHKTLSCFYCDQTYPDDKERIKHIDYEHPGKLYYPTPEDFEKRLL